MLTRLELEADLGALGIQPGDVVVVHSALRPLGWVDGAEEAVIDSLLAAVGASGTVCMPTLTFGRYRPGRPPPTFDPLRTPGRVGRIPERFRQRSTAIRSLHPTHSVAAIGAQAAELLRDHDRSPTPCGAESPWGRISRAGGKVLMLGVGTSACTMFHGPEEQAEPELRCTPPMPCRLITDGNERTVILRLHQPYRGAVSNRGRLKLVLESRGLLRGGRVGDATALLIDARGLWDLSLELIRASPSNRLDHMQALARSMAERLLSR